MLASLSYAGPHDPEKPVDRENGHRCHLGSETLADVVEQSEAQAAERSRQSAQVLAQERETWRAEMQSLLRRLTDAGARQERP